MLLLSDIAAEWIRALEGAVAVNDFCTGRFGREPVLLEGADRNELPGRKDAPYLAVVPVGIEAGESEDEHVFRLDVFLGVVDPEVERAGRVVRYRGYRTIEKEFNPLVLAALEASAHQPDSVEWAVSMVDTGLFELGNVITVTVPNTLGID